MAKVVITQPLPPQALIVVRAALGEATTVEMVTSLDEAEFARLAGDAEVLISGFRPIGAKLLALAPNVRFIQQLGAGYDNLDLRAISAAGIAVANTPGANSIAVAEHTILLMLALLKNFSRDEQTARANRWPTLAARQVGIGDLSTATVGLVGFGAISQAVAERLRPFGSRLLYTARNQADPATEQRLGVNYMSLPELLKTASIVSLHLPLNDHTRHFIGEKELAQMSPGSFLINTSRGGLVDEAALRQAVEQGQLRGAALDVLENEVEGGNPFTDLPQIIVTPHSGGISQAATARITQMAFGNVVRFFKGETPLYLLPAPGLPGAE